LRVLREHGERDDESGEHASLDEYHGRWPVIRRV